VCTLLEHISLAYLRTDSYPELFRPPLRPRQDQLREGDTTSKRTTFVLSFSLPVILKEKRDREWGGRAGHALVHH
jgi:hypothetical protein